MLGNEVATLVDEYKPAGNYEIEFDATRILKRNVFLQVGGGELLEDKENDSCFDKAMFILSRDIADLCPCNILLLAPSHTIFPAVFIN